jgi:hypothetical protein
VKLDQARRFALSLPEAREEPHHEAMSFRVGGKIFATVHPEGKHLHVFVDEEVREPLIAAEPTVYEPLRWGGKVLGVRVLLSKADSSIVSELLRTAWSTKAPKRLVAPQTESRKRK